VYYSNPDSVSVHDGFPNPATDSALQSIDLNALLIWHSASTYFMRIDGNSWSDQGIFDQDLVIADRALNPRPNDLIIWTRNDMFVISPRHRLLNDAAVWGVVTAVIHPYRSRS
jgi:SOS-response transcriptional repressor LexA